MIIKFITVIELITSILVDFKIYVLIYDTILDIYYQDLDIIYQNNLAEATNVDPEVNTDIRDFDISHPVKHTDIRDFDIIHPVKYTDIHFTSTR